MLEYININLYSIIFVKDVIDTVGFGETKKTCYVSNLTKKKNIFRFYFVIVIVVWKFLYSRVTVTGLLFFKFAKT